jgi:uncharacterized integral membrane protein
MSTTSTDQKTEDDRTWRTKRNILVVIIIIIILLLTFLVINEHCDTASRYIYYSF